MDARKRTVMLIFDFFRRSPSIFAKSFTDSNLQTRYSVIGNSAIIRSVSGVRAGTYLSAPLVVVAILILFVAASQPAPAKQPLDPYVASAVDDASLNSVFAATADRVWAVGDRGAIWSTADGGRNWSKQVSGTSANLHAVAFKSPLEGCAVGGLPGALSQLSRGVILRTKDGGENWNVVPSDGLPRFTGMRSLGGRLVAWGDYSPLWKTGIFYSMNDGLTWQAMQSSILHVAALGTDRSGNVLAVDRVGNAFNSQFGPLKSLFTTPPSQPIAFVEHLGTTWMAGGADGQLLRTVNGQVWAPVTLPLSPEAQRACSWRAVGQFEDQLWIIGTPGSVVLHSADQGLNWQIHSTGQTLPLRSIVFADKQRGWAVGPLSLILATRDGGRSWYPQRQTAARLGLLAITATDAQVPWASLVGASWDELVASSSIAIYADSPEQSADYRVEKWKFHEAIAPQVGMTDHQSWQQNKASMLTQQDLKTLTTRLAVELQSWRPDVVLTNETGGDRLLPENRAAMVAITNSLQIAKTSLPYGVGAELLLPAWQVTKLATVTEPRLGQYSEHPNRLMREPGLSIWDLLIPTGVSFNANAESVSIRTLQQEQSTLANNASLFGGIAPSTATRRQTNSRSLGNYQLIMGRVPRMTSLDNLITLPPETPITEWQTQLDFVARALPSRELAPSLLRIVHGCTSPNLWPRRQIALERLIQLQPTSDAASSARLLLLQMLSSDEMRAWKNAVARESLSKIELTASANSPNTVSIGAVSSLSPFDTAVTSATANSNSAVSDGQLAQASFSSPVAASTDAISKQSSADQQLNEAFFMALDTCYKSDPFLAKLPELELMRESVQRTKSETSRLASSDGKALELILGLSALAGWPQAAQQELLLANGKLEHLRWIAFAVATNTRPQLDGALDEEMWAACPPMQLAATSKSTTSSAQKPTEPTGAATVRWSYDDRYLYIGIDAPLDSTTAAGKPPKLRKYDSDLDATDFMHFTLDTDRDYSSAIELAVSATGLTFDRCCDLVSYNPKYSVAVPEQQRAGRWSAEIAIRISDMTTQTSLTGRAWAVSARRKNPKGQAESWSSMITEQVALKSAGLLLFVPPRDGLPTASSQ